MQAKQAIHADLDSAATAAAAALGLPTWDARDWGPRLRYCTSTRAIDAFARAHAPHAAPFTLTGSGDFHHLAAVFLAAAIGRAALPRGERAVLVSFDNHPDWDLRPPRWACGGWLNRALGVSSRGVAVEMAAVWGCGNFELAWPGRFWRRRGGRVQVFPARERLAPRDARRYPAFDTSAFNAAFEDFARTLSGRPVYITVDIDCLRASDAVSNWEHGVLSTAQVCAALRTLHRHARVFGGDLCGAWSLPRYARPLQHLAAWWDHPPIPLPPQPPAPQPLPRPPHPSDMAWAQRLNAAAIADLWPALVGEPGPG
jgi:arginase family enzyme